MTQPEQAGAVVTDPARDRFCGGYSGYFHDPGGHLWEIAWNPHWAVASCPFAVDGIRCVVVAT